MLSSADPAPVCPVPGPSWSDTVEAGTLARDALLVAVAYLAGSIPFGVIAARLAGGPDPRTIGSGRTGGTNALRALGRRWAALVVLGDLAKGVLPILLARWIAGDPAIEALCGIAAVFGASHSAFLRLRGGRGVGTGVGTMLVIQPLGILLAAPVFFGVVLVTGYVSLGSLLSSAAMAPALLLAWWILGQPASVVFLVYALVGAALIWIAHADNIARLVRGNERRLDLSLLTGRGPEG